MTEPSRITDRCCGADCWNEGGECWGKVEVIDEEWDGEDCRWIHGCEGHRRGYSGPYVAEG